MTDFSTILSYQKTTQELKRNEVNCNVSRQTVMNTLRKIDNLQTIVIFIIIMRSGDFMLSRG
jgi:hypothetical protein